MGNEIEDLIKELDEEFGKDARDIKMRRENPWVLDIIGVLYPHRGGLHRRLVIAELWRKRGEKGLNMPKAFEQAVQSAFQGYAGEYATFRGKSDADDLFHAPQGKGAGVWAVRQERVEAWLRAKRKTLPGSLGAVTTQTETPPRLH